MKPSAGRGRSARHRNGVLAKRGMVLAICTIAKRESEITDGSVKGATKEKAGATETEASIMVTREVYSGRVDDSDRINNEECLYELNHEFYVVPISILAVSKDADVNMILHLTVSHSISNLGELPQKTIPSFVTR